MAALTAPGAADDDLHVGIDVRPSVSFHTNPTFGANDDSKGSDGGKKGVLGGISDFLHSHNHGGKKDDPEAPMLQPLLAGSGSRHLLRAVSSKRMGERIEFCGLSRTTVGLVLFAASTLCVTLMSTTAKLLSQGGMPVFETVLARSAIMVFFTAPVLLAERHSPFGNRKGLLLLRALLGFGSVSSIYWAVSLLPLSDATLLSFLAPLIVAILAPTLLGESPSPMALTAVPVCLVGVALVVQPPLFNIAGRSLPLIGVAIGVSQAFFSAGAKMCVRELRRSEASSVIVFAMAAVSTIGAALFCTFLPNSFRMPIGVREWLLLGGTGLAGLGNQIFMTAGLRRVQALPAIALSYLSVVWGLGLGALIFGERPNMLSLFGAVVICCCTLLLSVHEAKRPKPLSSVDQLHVEDLNESLLPPLEPGSNGGGATAGTGTQSGSGLASGEGGYRPASLVLDKAPGGVAFVVGGSSNNDLAKAVATHDAKGDEKATAPPTTAAAMDTSDAASAPPVLHEQLAASNIANISDLSQVPHVGDSTTLATLSTATVDDVLSPLPSYDSSFSAHPSGPLRFTAVMREPPSNSTAAAKDLADAPALAAVADIVNAAADDGAAQDQQLVAVVAGSAEDIGEEGDNGAQVGVRERIARRAAAAYQALAKIAETGAEKLHVAAEAVGLTGDDREVGSSELREYGDDGEFGKK